MNRMVDRALRRAIFICPSSVATLRHRATERSIHQFQKEHLPRIAPEAKPAQRNRRHIFSERKILKPRPEQFRMQQGLQRTTLIFPWGPASE
jgi:hypothetical protein